MKTVAWLAAAATLATMAGGCAPQQPYYSSNPNYAYSPGYTYRPATYAPGYTTTYYSTPNYYGPPPRYYRSKWDYYRNYNGIHPPSET